MKTAVPEAHERQQIEAAQRDPIQFAALYENNFPRVFAFVARRVPTREEAEDLTSEVFHQALASLQGFRWQGTPFVGWLLGIASHLIAKRWQQMGTLFSQLVNRLPEDQRYVILRRFADERSIREIAQELARSEGAVKQLQLRALENLRSQVRSHHE